MSEESDAPIGTDSIGVINPYALAEIIRGQSFEWEEEDTRTVFEETFERPYSELFDPQYDSPLYPGVKLTGDGVVKLHGVTDLDLQEEEENETHVDPDISDLTRVGDLSDALGVEDVSKLEVARPEVMTPESVRLEVRPPEAERRASTFRPIPRELVEFITNIGGSQEEWTPSNAEWEDPGDFFRETGEFFDPIQGSVANCYYIAALSAVAWATPYRISHRTRATGATQQEFFDMIEFYSGDSPEQVEVSENIPLRTPSSSLVYARSSESGEIWPAVYEKAYAKWKTGTSSDKPNITATAFGDPVGAAAELTGLSRSYFSTSSTSAGDLWSQVRANSRSYKTFNPMVAWTYSSGTAAPSNVNYSSANIVANHAYSVLGWDYHQGTKYIAVRNPWGRTEATVGTLSGVWTPYDESFWRRIRLPDVDGTFAVTASTFKQYFAGLGVVK